MSDTNPQPQPVPADDVLWCYRYLLGRQPDSDAAVAWHARSPSFRALVEGFVRSAEFQAIVRAGSAWTRNKPMPTSSPNELQAFARSFHSDLQTLRSLYGVRSLEVQPLDSSPLYLKDDTGRPINVHLPSDDFIGLTAVLEKQWEIGKPKFVAQVAAGIRDDLILIDVGANVGLFSRQCLSLTSKVSRLYAYEPHPSNFSLLTRNLSGIEKAQLCNFGLGQTTATASFFLDGDNAGNYSLNVNAMTDNFATTTISIVAAAEEEDKWLRHQKPIFYKSDTQGSDETIATSLSDNFWDNVNGAIFELWRIPGKDFDADRLAQILDRFANKVFDKQPGSNVSSSQVIQYLQSTDRQFDDLLVWRS
jgi:FkbM family methyltransferase